MVLQRLRDVGASVGSPEGASDAVIAFEVSGGAPGERYAYRLTVHGDGSAERRIIDELQPGKDGLGHSAVDRQLASQVFAAAATSGLLDDSAPTGHVSGGEILPDSMVAILTVRGGDAVRRIAVPALDPAVAVGNLPGETSDIPLQTPFLLPASSAAMLGPVLEALRAVEVTL